MLRTTLLRGALSLAVVGVFAACQTSKSQNPTAPSVAGPIPGVNITAPKPLEPYTGTEIVSQQGTAAVTLLIENPSTTGERTLWLSVELATDANFSKIVHQADRLTPGANGRTSYRIPDALAAGYTYYWRTRAQDGANTGPYSGAFQFQVVNQVVIDPPGLVEPQGNLATNRPEFKARNGTWSNTSGVVYRFELSTAADFSSLSAVVTASPGSNGTTSISLGELPYERTYYWRAYATDNYRNSTYSETLSFKTPAAPKPVAPTPSPTPASPAPVDASQWTTEQWKTFFYQVQAAKGGPTVSDAGMWAMRGDFLARGADYQNAWRGDIRPRLFLPVPGCPPATSANVPACSYNRPVDFGPYGGAWQWIPRF